MSRPRTEPIDRVSTNMRLPPDLHRELHDAAAKRDVSVNYIVVRAIREWLGSHGEIAI